MKYLGLKLGDRDTVSLESNERLVSMLKVRAQNVPTIRVHIRS
jgi:hypothetical protein